MFSRAPLQTLIHQYYASAAIHMEQTFRLSGQDLVEPVPPKNLTEWVPSKGLIEWIPRMGLIGWVKQ